MNKKPGRKVSLAAGALYLLTFVSIPTLSLYGPITHDPTYILGQGPDTPVVLGALLELIVALANVGTSVVLFPVLKRQNEGVALGFVGSRIMESGTIFAGIASLLAVVSLRQAGAGAGALVTAQALVGLHRWFFLGQGIFPAVNALLLGSLLYQSRLVPRVLPVVGMIGSPLLLAPLVAVMFGAIHQTSPISLLAAIPVALWELSLGLWLTARGFTASAVDALAATTATV